MQTRSSPNIQTLHSLARQVSIPGYESMSKSILFNTLKEKFDVERVNRLVNRNNNQLCRSYVKKRSSNEISDDIPMNNSSNSSNNTIKSKKRIKLNKIDPIMFTPIKKTKLFTIDRPNVGAVAFNIDTLIDYISKTGDYTDPVTRIPLSDQDLIDIDEKAKKLGLIKPSIYELKKNPTAFNDSKFRRDALLGLERCAGEVVTDILNIIETCEPDESQMRLVLKELPTFADYYRQLREADVSYANQCMTHWKLFLQGPPNKPNDDIYGLIEIVCNFFKACESGSVPFAGF